MYIKLCNSL